MIESSSAESTSTAYERTGPHPALKGPKERHQSQSTWSKGFCEGSSEFIEHTENCLYQIMALWINLGASEDWQSEA